MSAEQNKSIVLRFHEAFNNADLGTAETLFDVNAIAHFPGMPGPLDMQAFKQVGAAYLAAFPKGETTVETAIAEGDVVATRGTYRGTQHSEFMGISATGKTVEITWMAFSRVVDGKIVEHWVDQDNLRMMQQLGVIPEPQA
jgi:predicted ester cyclase